MNTKNILDILTLKEIKYLRAYFRFSPLAVHIICKNNKNLAIDLWEAIHKMRTYGISAKEFFQQIGEKMP